MNTEQLMVAFNAFVHVCGGWVIVIAVISVVTGSMRKYILQDKSQRKLTKHENWGSLLSTYFSMSVPFCRALVVPVSIEIKLHGVWR